MIVLDWRYGAWLALGPSKSDESIKLAEFVAKCERAGIRVVVEEAPEPSTGGEDFYGPIMGARRGARMTRSPTSDPISLARTRSG